MRYVARLLCWFSIFASLILCCACPKQAARVNMTVNAAADINRDADGHPLSVVVRVYQLKDKGRLESAEYGALLKSDTLVLAGDLLESKERILQPGAQDILEINSKPETNYLGIVALFRNPSGDSWRKIIPVKGKDLKITVSLRAAGIDVVLTGK